MRLSDSHVHAPTGKTVAGMGLLVLSLLWLFGSRNSYHIIQSDPISILGGPGREAWRWPFFLFLVITALGLLMWELVNFMDAKGWLGSHHD